MIIEACVTTLDEAVASVAAGATRLELCADLDVGGLTPDIELLRLVKAAVDVPVLAMARPRPGGFVYTSAEVDATVMQIRALRAAGADGVVVGALAPGGAIDGRAVAEWVAAAAPLPTTFHRAFDEVVDPLAAVDRLRELGVRRLLTAGGRGPAREGVTTLAALVRRAGDALQVVAGGGVRAGHVRVLVEATGVRAVHARAEGIPGIPEALGGTGLPQRGS